MISDAQIERMNNDNAARIILNYEESVNSGPGEEAGKTYRG